MTEAFVGIDVAFAKRKRLPVSVCTWKCGRLVPFALRDLDIEPPRGHGNVAVLDEEPVASFASETAAYLERVATRLDLEITRIAIDAPSAPSRSGRRRAEQAMDEAGISCFATPTRAQFADIESKVRDHLAAGGPENRIPHANQLWMLAGFALFRRLGEMAECIEVFPQATVRALGAGAVHKFKTGGVEAQSNAVARQTGWPTLWDQDPELTSIAWAPAHDCLDAYMSAWVAALDEEDRFPFGSPPDDVIWVPRVGSAPWSETSEERPAEESSD